MVFNIKRKTSKLTTFVLFVTPSQTHAPLSFKNLEYAFQQQAQVYVRNNLCGQLEHDNVS